MSAATVNLHGIERQPFMAWNEEDTYLEAVTVKTKADAIKRLTEEMAVDPDELNVISVHMRWVENEGEEAWISPIDGSEYREGWLECESDHPDAVPFWKDSA